MKQARDRIVYSFYSIGIFKTTLWDGPEYSRAEFCKLPHVILITYQECQYGYMGI
jgi:hypothetical protein